jgi:hypothetical protein
MGNTVAFVDNRPRAVRLGYWTYARQLALMVAPAWVALAVLNFHEGAWLSNVELAALMLLLAGAASCAISFCMWAGVRCAWRYGGKIARWAAVKHAYGERDSG